MKDYFIRAYLDDYKLITIEMDISFFGGECNRFDLIKEDLIIPLQFISKTKRILILNISILLMLKYLFHRNMK